MIKYLSNALCLITILLGTSKNPIGKELAIEVTNLANNNGYVLISVYDDANAFPEHAAKAVRTARVKIKDAHATTIFSDLPDGVYAVAILHDENNNLKMDFNLIGMPKEGYGFSNNAKGTFGPPSFKKASFVFKKANLKIKLKALYLFK